MAYIGTPVQQALTKVTSQSFNGTGSQTVFTLNRAVNTGEELEVFVNNVQQEPGVGKSYTATGTTLTFDAAPSSGTGNIYVIYRGLAEVTRRLEHDPNQALAATTGTFSGNVLVATTSIAPATTTSTGIAIRADGKIDASASAQPASRLNRTTSDGDILQFRKDGTIVGSIGTVSDKIYIGSSAGGDTFLRLNSNTVTPANSSGADRDATINLGYSGGRFKNLFLSGGVYLGGTGSANALDDYEEGTFTPTIGLNSGGTTVTYTTQDGFYTKVGNIVHALVRIANSSHTSTTGGALWRISGLPFTTDSSDAGGYFAYNNNSANIWGSGRASNGDAYVLIYGSYPSNSSTYMTITYRTNA